MRELSLDEIEVVSGVTHLQCLQELSPWVARQVTFGRMPIVQTEAAEQVPEVF